MKLAIGFWLFVAPIFFAAKAPADADCGSTKVGLRDLGKWLAEKEWAVIRFNWGLHNQGYHHADDTNLSANGDYATPNNGAHHNIPLVEYGGNFCANTSQG